MKKELLLIIFLAIVFSSFGVNAVTTGLVSPANPGHNGTQVLISVGTGKYITLQNAVDYGYMVKANTSIIATIPFIPTSSPYELGSQVIIPFKNVNITLQNAVDNNVFNGGTMPASVNSIPAGAEFASSIKINTTSGVINLKSAIETNVLSSVGNPGGSCSPPGVDSICVNPGTIQNGVCTGYTFNIGVWCGSDSSVSCDNTGHCRSPTSTGTGCGSCPYGTTSVSAQGYTFKGCALNGNEGRFYNNFYWYYSSAFWTPWSYSTSGQVRSNTIINIPAATCSRDDCSCGAYGCSTCDVQWQMKQ